MKQLEEFTWIGQYLSYLELRKKGLKQKAQIQLNEFFKEFSLHDKISQRNFIDSVSSLAFITFESDLYLPYNLYHTVFLPEIDKWTEEEPLNPIPHRWSNDFEKNKKALELNAHDEIAIEKLANYVIGKVSMNQHEISAGYPYQGDPPEDIVLIDFLLPFVTNLSDVTKQQKIKKTLNELKNSAKEYKR
jgi:hypothetical protein